MAGLSGNVRVALDDQAIFLADDNIEHTDLDGASRTTLQVGRACDIAIDEQRVFFINEEGVSSLTRTGQPDAMYHSNDLPPNHQALCRTLALETDTLFYKLGGGSINNLGVATKGTPGAMSNAMPEGVGAPHVGPDALYFQVGTSLQRLDDSTGDLVDVVELGEDVSSIQLNATHAYWIQTSFNAAEDVAIKRAPLDGGAVETIYAGSGLGCGYTTTFAMDDSHVYFGVNLEREGTGDPCHVDDVYAIARVPLAGGARTVIASRGSIRSIDQIFVNDSRVYVVDVDFDWGATIKHVAK